MDTETDRTEPIVFGDGWIPIYESPHCRIEITRDARGVCVAIQTEPVEGYDPPWFAHATSRYVWFNREDADYHQNLL